MSHETWKEIGKMSLGILILGALMLLIFALCGYFNLETVLGGVVGCAFSILNFAFLGYSVEKAVTKGEKGAQGYMGFTYFLRMGLTAAVVIWAIKAPYLNYLPAVIPLIFPRIVILFNNLIKKGGSDS